MQFILLCSVVFSLGFSGLAHAQGSCAGSAPTRAALLSHFTPGSVKASLGAVTVQSFSRTCTPLSGCSAWSEKPVGLSYEAVNDLRCSRVSDVSTPVYSFGHVPVALPAGSEAALVLNNTDIELQFTLGSSTDGPVVNGKIASFKTNPPPAYTSTDAHSFAFKNFTGMAVPSDWYEDDQTWGRCTVRETNFIEGRFDVAGVTKIEDIASLQWGDHCFEAVYQKKGVVQADGSYTEAQVQVSSNF